VRQSAEVENDMNSVERMLHYATEVEQEAANEIPENKPPAPWPSEGKIEMKDIVLKYRPGLPAVIKGASTIDVLGSVLTVSDRNFHDCASRREDWYCGKVTSASRFQFCC
jgi:hypothetical protein